VRKNLTESINRKRERERKRERWEGYKPESNFVIGGSFPGSCFIPTLFAFFLFQDACPRFLFRTSATVENARKVES